MNGARYRHHQLLCEIDQDVPWEAYIVQDETSTEESLRGAPQPQQQQQSQPGPSVAVRSAIPHLESLSPPCRLLSQRRTATAARALWLKLVSRDQEQDGDDDTPRHYVLRRQPPFLSCFFVGRYDHPDAESEFYRWRVSHSRWEPSAALIIVALVLAIRLIDNEASATLQVFLGGSILVAVSCAVALAAIELRLSRQSRQYKLVATHRLLSIVGYVVTLAVATVDVTSDADLCEEKARFFVSPGFCNARLPSEYIVPLYSIVVIVKGFGWGAMILLCAQITLAASLALVGTHSGLQAGFICSCSASTAVFLLCYMRISESEHRNNFESAVNFILMLKDTEEQRGALRCAIRAMLPWRLRYRWEHEALCTALRQQDHSDQALIVAIDLRQLAGWRTGDVLRMARTAHQVFHGFDRAASETRMDVAGVIGDVYALSSGLHSSVADGKAVVDFMRLLPFLFDRGTAVIGIAVTCGVAQSEFSHRTCLRYLVSGPAIDAAVRLSRTATDEHASLTASAYIMVSVQHPLLALGLGGVSITDGAIHVVALSIMASTSPRTSVTPAARDAALTAGHVHLGPAAAPVVGLRTVGSVNHSLSSLGGAEGSNSEWSVDKQRDTERERPDALGTVDDNDVMMADESPFGGHTTAPIPSNQFDDVQDPRHEEQEPSTQPQQPERHPNAMHGAAAYDVSWSGGFRNPAMERLFRVRVADSPEVQRTTRFTLLSFAALQLMLIVLLLLEGLAFNPSTVRGWQFWVAAVVWTQGGLLAAFAAISGPLWRALSLRLRIALLAFLCISDVAPLFLLFHDNFVVSNQTQFITLITGTLVALYLTELPWTINVFLNVQWIALPMLAQSSIVAARPYGSGAATFFFDIAVFTWMARRTSLESRKRFALSLTVSRVTEEMVASAQALRQAVESNMPCTYIPTALSMFMDSDSTLVATHRSSLVVAVVQLYLSAHHNRTTGLDTIAVLSNLLQQKLRRCREVSLVQSLGNELVFATGIGCDEHCSAIGIMDVLVALRDVVTNEGGALVAASSIEEAGATLAGGGRDSIGILRYHVLGRAVTISRSMLDAVSPGPNHRIGSSCVVASDELYHIMSLSQSPMLLLGGGGLGLRYASSTTIQHRLLGRRKAHILHFV